ncbi:glyoxylate/hydroxypyruvate reductase A [Telmatospirillum sp. J64-1]|uniref:2-hydroxyacid dehydrogenase n=1 Tax=Telmatospirillum sp. J64-1 TaxID=2502183 RepID=UPI00115C819B|nr:glyoxylate/hydroxypyruvate reductase A [Telmatospirillum sp. J64-1]
MTEAPQQGAILFYSEFDDPEEWRGHLRELAPWLDFRVWPDVGDPADIEWALVWKPPPGELRRFPNLRLIVNLGAGADSILADRTLPEHVPICRIVDPEMGRMMAQFALLAVMRHHRDFVSFERAKRQAEWRYIHPKPASAVRVGVMGLGSLGREAAALIASMGYRVAGWSRSPKRLEGIDTYAGQEELGAFLARSDILISLLPLTEETRDLIGRDVFSRLPRGAVFISLGRGHVVDEDALVEALRSGQVGEATLDVFRQEPLPKEHPFWAMEQVMITPHLASVAMAATSAPQVVENLLRTRAGQPPLNEVDRRKGY